MRMEQLFDDLEDFGAFDDAISGDVRDPYTQLARLRREEPVQRLETSGALPHEESLPMFIVYRHEDVQQMLRDNETFSSAAVIAAFGPAPRRRCDARHGRAPARWLRSLVQKAFTQKSLARWQDELVGRVANSLIDKFAPNGKADLVKEFTFDYPSQIIAGLLGLPEKDYPQFQRWSISLLSWLMNPERGLAASAALCDYFAPILEARRADPEGRPDQRARCRRGRRGRNSPTRRSSPSCGCCCPLAWRRPTGRWAVLCSDGRTPRNSWTRSVRTGRCFPRRSRRACGGNPRC